MAEIHTFAQLILFEATFIEVFMSIRLHFLVGLIWKRSLSRARFRVKINASVRTRIRFSFSGANLFT